MVCRTYSAFAAEQVDGFKLPTEGTDRDTPEQVTAADAYFDCIGIDVANGHNHACYRPVVDRIEVPHLTQLNEPALYYSTQAHEHVHATGHESRLDRDLTGRFGSDACAVEELVAELGAAFWCARFGLSPATRDDHTAYLAHWVRVLREHPRVLLTACSKAQLALDWLDRAAANEAPAQEDAA